MTSSNHERLSLVFQRLANRCAEGPLTLGQLVSAFQDKGHMLICLIFAAPFLLPIPLPGVSTVFGAMIALAAVQVMAGQNVWIPKSWADRGLPGGHAEAIFNRFSRILQATEHLVRPRWSQVFRGQVIRKLNGMILLILAGLLALPMPPGFNAPPGFAICILAIGVIESDGLLVVFSWILTLANIALFATFFTLGWEGIQALMRWFH